MLGPQNSHWVRTRTEEGRAAFLAEQKAEEERALHPGAGAVVALALGVGVLVVGVVWVLL
ncbi:hypothetical protein [Streptomyces xiaopingdaonensis]|uniref:hypothetical protein n=1 Tax=Streptomyces xiaopingdaonensis TaxID=1565415 RepID=UPI00030CA6FA|nr:hypothetical protein [Streptomyces xiaopingdaonensis]